MCVYMYKCLSRQYYKGLQFDCGDVSHFHEHTKELHASVINLIVS